MGLAALQMQALQSAARARLPLWGDYALADPLVLLVVPVALVLLVLRLRAHAPGRTSVVAPLPRTLRARTRWMPPVLQFLALACATVALARPLRSNVSLDVRSEGVDIALVVDRSGSMQFEDLEQGKDRLTVVKEVVGDFAQRRMTDREGAADSVALIAFARYPRLLCPFTPASSRRSSSPSVRRRTARRSASRWRRPWRSCASRTRARACACC
jgi:hypothetical protein